MSPPVHRCLHCSREFARSEHLVRHERTHTKEKPYGCGLCSHAFSRQDLLRRHEIKAHNRNLRPREPVANGSSRSSGMPDTISDPVLSESECTQGDAASSAVEAPRPPENPPGKVIEFSGVSFGGHTMESSDAWMSEFLPGIPPAASLGSPLEQDIVPGTFDWLDSSHLSHTFPHPMDIEPRSPGVPSTILNTDTTSMFRDARQQIPPEVQSVVSAQSLIHSCSITEDHPGGTVIAPLNDDHLALSDSRWQVLSQQVAESSKYSLPPRDVLCGFMSRYFSNFHRHQPFIHESTWSPDQAPLYLILAVCANGAVYSLEKSIAADLFHLAVEMMPPCDSGLLVLQAMMLLAAFASWSGDLGDIQLAIQLQGRMTLAVRREWALMESPIGRHPMSWEDWRRREALKRVTYCVFTVTNLMAVAFDLPSAISLEDECGMPSQEDQWCASSEEHWEQLVSETEPQEWDSAGAIITRLLDPSLPVPSRIGMFGCHVIISAILQKIMFLQRSVNQQDPEASEIRQRFLRVLRRWQLMWESEPEASLAPDHPRGPILFNCTAILRLAYIRLVANYAPVRRAFTVFVLPDEISSRIDTLRCPRRDKATAMAALQACLALRIPAHLGFKVIARTSFWGWSVQHALSYFECALLLSQWLQNTENVPAEDQSADERSIINMVEQILTTSRPDPCYGENLPLSIAVLLLWAELLDTGDTTVWKIMPKMAKVLRARAEKLLTRSPSAVGKL